MNESDAIRNAYANAECPDCLEDIPRDVSEGQECVNCGHIFSLPEADDD